MCGGGGQSSTSTVSIPPEVLKNYQEVFARGKQVAEKPFQEYSKDPNAFVAGMTPTQQAALDNINAVQGMATPDVQEGQGYIRQGMEEGRGLQGESLGTAQRGQGIGEELYGRSLNTSSGGLSDARQIYGQALPAVQRAAATGENYAQDAAARLYAGLNQAQPYMGEAANLTRMGLGAGQQYAGMAGGYLGAGTQGVGPGAFNTEQYMSPYLNQVVRAQQALQAEENETQRSALKGNAIRAGAFGGDRAGIAQANLARQQSLANQATLSNLLQQGYGQAQGVAGQQQQVELGAAQANRAAQQFGAQQAAALGQQQFGQGLSAAQQQAALGQALYAQNIGQGQAIASLGQQQYGQGLGSAQAAAGMGKDIYGMSAQEAQLQQAAAQGMFGQAAQVAALQQSAGNNIFNYGLQGGQGIANLGLANQQAQMQAAQAQMQMGQVQQQTDQAGKTAMYNQFTQQQGYPYQQAQFLANLAMGTGALSGSTTTTNSSGGGFFSDRRLKDNAEKIGETFDGQAIYRYNYKGEDHMQIGMMAQDVEKHNPDAVGRSQGYKTLDYEKATDKAAERGHFYSGGLVPASMGGAVSPYNYYEGYARGGYAEGGDAGQWSLVRKATDEDGNDRGGPDQWTNSATGEIRYGSDPSIAEAAAAKKTASELDPRINEAYQTNVFRDATKDEAEAFQDRLKKGDSIGSITSDIANSREKNLVNQTPLTYDASKFAQYASPVRNRYGAAAAPSNSYRSSFDPAPVQRSTAQATGRGPNQATGTGQLGGSTSSQQPMNYGQMGGGYGQTGGGYAQQPMAYNQPQAAGKGPSAGGGYGQQMGGGYGQQAGGYGGGYGGGYQQPSQMNQFNQNYNQGYSGGYQPMQQQQASGKGVGPSSYQSNYGYSNPYGMGAPNQSSYDMGASAPQASGKGPSSSGSGGAQAFRDGGRIGYAKGGGGHLDPNDLAAIAAQRMMELAPHAAGMPGQTMPGAQSYVSNKQLHVPKLVTADTRVPAQVNPFDQAISMAGKINSVGDSFSERGLFGRAISRLTTGSPSGGAASGASGTGSAPVVASSSEADLSAKSAKPASYEFGPSDEFRIPGYDPSLDYASGGLVPHYGLGGSLPYGGSEGGGGYIPEELLQPQQIQGLPKNDAELRSAAAKATASGSGGLGDVMKAGNLGYKLAPESLKTSLRSIFPGATPATPPAGLGAAAETASIAPANAAAPVAEGLGAAAPVAEGLGVALPAAAETAAAAAPVAAEAVAGLTGAAIPAAAEAAAAAAAAASAALPAAATAATVAAPAAAEGLMALLAMLPAVFSDRRLKENIDPVGKTYDGQTIYRYNFKGDDRTQIGLIAQDVEKRHKDAVGSYRGMKTVDYKRATEDAADRGHFYNGGLVPYRRGYAEGMTVDEADLPAIGAQDVERQENPLAPLINRTAEKIGVRPVDLGTAISYETAGTFDPWKRGPTTKWGEHRGLLQWGEPQRKQYGVTQDSTLEEQMDAAGRYLVDRGVKPGMGLKDIYSAINAGRVGRYNASDERAGGAPGTVEDKVAGMGDHRVKAARLLGIDLGNTSDQATSRPPANIPDRTDASRAVALAKQPSDGSFPIRPPATAKGKEQDWSDFITSKQFILPALTAIATMGTTPTRNLGTALSAGLLGGVTSYQNLDKTLAEQELESRKVSSTEQTTRTNTFTKNMQLLEILNRRKASYTGRGEAPPPDLVKQIEDITKQLTESGAGQSLTSGAAVLGPPKTTTTGRVGATTPEAGKPDEKKTGTEGTGSAVPSNPAAEKPVPEVPTLNQALGAPSSGTANSDFQSKLNPDFNPVELNRRAALMAGDDPVQSRALADKAISIQQEMNRSGFGVGRDGSSVAIPGHADEKVLRDAAPKLHESFEQQAAQYRARQVAKERLLSIAESLSYIQSGKGVPAINEFVAGMQTAGFGGLIPKDISIIDTDRAQKIAKEAWAQVFESLKAIGGQPRVLEMQGLQQSGANLGLTPGANKSILASTLASFNYEDKFFEDAAKAYKEQGYRYSDSTFMPEWRRNNRLNTMKEEAEKNLAIRGATPVNSNGTLNFNELKDGYTYVVERDQMPGVTKPTKYRVVRDKDGKRGFEEVR